MAADGLSAMKGGIGMPQRDGSRGKDPGQNAIGLLAERPDGAAEHRQRGDNNRSEADNRGAD
jgi:hypothetical protein